MEGVEPPGAPVATARLTRALGPRGPRETYRDAVIVEENGVRRVDPLSTAGSHDIATHARANALIRIPAGGDPLDAGSIVTCVLLEH
jgi:molybdopterin biosynthesis enzyme